MAGERFVLTFEAAPADVPACVRIRRLLKHAGRVLRLRCVRVEPLYPEGADDKIERCEDRIAPSTKDGAGRAVGK
jgi:hypothetical protein